jgi:hypothetical protein
MGSALTGLPWDMVAVPAAAICALLSLLLYESRRQLHQQLAVVNAFHLRERILGKLKGPAERAEALAQIEVAVRRGEREFQIEVGGKPFLFRCHGTE